jgi:GMP synthase (glutamine-hydrolysing)
MTQTAHPDSVLIVDFGSQVTQLIARRVREAGVYCEIVPFQSAEEGFHRLQPKAVILSGSPASTVDEGSPRAPQIIFDSGLPVFGICYGQQTMCMQLGGKVESGHHREFGRAFLEVDEDSKLFEGLWSKGSRHQVWMSHGDRVTALPEGFKVVATSPNAPYAFIADEKRKYYGVQFHPEVVHTPDGAKLIGNFIHNIAGIKGDWSMSAYRQKAVDTIREQVGDKRVLCALSGGVDSSVAALLIHEAIGDKLTCVLVDHGLMRKDEAANVVAMFREHYNLHLIHVDASDKFIGELEGVSDPETKRKIIGRLFIETFEEEAKKLGGADFLGQGTLYPDVIESVSFTGGPSVTIKSHHNVGGLPERMNMQLVEPLRELFKDEVRVLGKELGLPDSFIGRHPFPGPGLAIRCPGYHPRKAGDSPRSRRHLSRRDPQGRPLRRDLAGIRRAVAGADRRRHGRRPHLRVRLRAARRDLGRWHDGGFLPLRHGIPRPRRHPHHQRSARHQPRRLRRDQQAAGHDRVGMRGSITAPS